jgi:hypothetical protein
MLHKYDLFFLLIDKLFYEIIFIGEFNQTHPNLPQKLIKKYIILIFVNCLIVIYAAQPLF